MTSGWRGESKRHSLAARGIKTKKYPTPGNTKFFDVEPVDGLSLYTYPQKATYDEKLAMYNLINLGNRPEDIFKWWSTELKSHKRQSEVRPYLFIVMDIRDFNYYVTTDSTPPPNMVWVFNDYLNEANYAISGYVDAQGIQPNIAPTQGHEQFDVSYIDFIQGTLNVNDKTYREMYHKISETQHIQPYNKHEDYIFMKQVNLIGEEDTEQKELTDRMEVHQQRRIKELREREQNVNINKLVKAYEKKLKRGNE